LIKIYENLSLENLDGEIWREIEGYNRDYFISSLGRVKSLKFGKEKILKQNEDGNNYLCVNLYKNKKSKTTQIHLLMFEHFIVEIPKGYIIHHKDFTKNNRLDNFQMMTDREHKSLHHTCKIVSEESKKLISENHVGMLGLKHSEESKKLMSEKRKGENNPNSKLNEQKVTEIRIDLDEGLLTQKEIAEKFGVSLMIISQIKNRKLWRHI